MAKLSEYNPNREFGFSLLMEANSRAVIQKPTVEGFVEHVLNLPEGVPVIFATDHTSDIAVQTAAAEVSQGRNVDVASLSTNQADWKQRIPMMLFGARRHFHNVTNTFDKATNTAHTAFRMEDFTEMQEAMASGRDMVIAAHRPTKDGKLPSHGGFGAVTLAQLTGALIVPVSLNIESDEQVGLSADIFGHLRRLTHRPKATLRFGAPIELPRLSPQGVQYAELFLSGKRRRDLIQQSSPEIYQRARQTAHQLQEQSGIVMRALASQLPEEKRGDWGKIVAASA